MGLQKEARISRPPAPWKKNQGWCDRCVRVLRNREKKWQVSRRVGSVISSLTCYIVLDMRSIQLRPPLESDRGMGGLWASEEMGGMLSDRNRTRYENMWGKVGGGFLLNNKSFPSTLLLSYGHLFRGSAVHETIEGCGSSPKYGHQESPIERHDR